MSIFTGFKNLVAARRLAAGEGSLVPDHQFDSGVVGNWLSARGTTLLEIDAGRLLFTRQDSNDGVALALTLPAGDYDYSLTIGGPAGPSGARVFWRVASNQGLSSEVLNFEPGGSFAAEGTVFSGTFSLSVESSWFGVILIWNGGDVAWIDNLILLPS